MANGDANGRDSAEVKKLMEDYDRIVDAPDLDVKVKILGALIQGHAVSNLNRFREIRARLPWRPWMLKVVASFGAAGIAAIIWGASAFSSQVNATSRDACEAKQTAIEAKSDAVQVKDGLMAKIEPIAKATAVNYAMLHMLLKSRGLELPSENTILRVQKQLELLPDSGGK